MKNLLALAAIVLIAYYVYTSGILSRAVQSNPSNDNSKISVTVYSPFGTGSTKTPRSNQVTSTPLPPINATATSVPVNIEPTPFTPPPPTIIVPIPAPTLAAVTTPTPSSAFTLTLETPHDGETLHISPVLVIGQTSPGAVVSVNDAVSIANPQGRFSLAVPLQEGPNVLEVIASDSAGEQVFVILTVLYQP
ncbi:MAG TPA: hypothetical protein VFK30_09505 [Anaerolineae bacterium]|nr:hypothetical protein [Anaerolineae bacterium]